MNSTLKSLIDQTIVNAGLPSGFEQTVHQYYMPVAEKISRWHNEASRTIVIGINGGQGSGKSTMAAFLKVLLEHHYELATAVLSIDDIYLTRNERKELADHAHPLLITRGCPGTHDVELGISTIRKLGNAQTGEVVSIPSFNKAQDDRRPSSQWPSNSGSVDIIIFEGWCIGARPQPDELLTTPVNTMESTEDKGGTWRQYVNQALRNEYQTLFSLLDHLIMLKVPGFDSVKNFRLKQEEKLRQRMSQCSEESSKIMSEKQVLRFIMHYQRLTEWMLQEMPSYADIVIEVSENHQLASITTKQH